MKMTKNFSSELGFMRIWLTWNTLAIEASIDISISLHAVWAHTV